MIYQLHAVERSYDDIEVAQTSSGVRRYRPSVNRGRYKTECFTWNTVSTKQQMTLNVNENPKCGIFYVFYRENRVIIGGSTG